MQAPAGGSRLLTMKKPVGPCLFVTPWNFPLAMGTRKIGPAVAAGCTMVLKPAAQTPLTMLALAGDHEPRRACPTGCSTSSRPPATRDAQRRRSRPTTGCARSASPAPPPSGGCWSSSPPTGPAAGQHGARRQRPVPGLRRRRPRRRGRRGDGGQDAQHGRGLHLGQPVPGARRRGRGVRARSWPPGWVR